MDQLLAFSNEEKPPQILQGEGAGLDKLRGTFVGGPGLSNTPPSAVTFNTAFHQVRVDEDERMLMPDQGVRVTATWKIDDDQNTPHDFVDEKGRAFVTTERLLFVSERESSKDIAMDAACVSLHAMCDKPCSVYVQVQDVDAEEMSPMELTMVLDDTTECKPLFDAFSKLVTLHPVELDEDEDGDDEGGLGNFVVAPSKDDGATEEERDAMLQRLDDMLVVPPQLQRQNDGQFDDAEEDEDDTML